MNLKTLLENLVCCPECKDDSELQKESEGTLVCSRCKSVYSLREVPGPDGSGVHIPVLMKEIGSKD